MRENAAGKRARERAREEGGAGKDRWGGKEGCSWHFLEELDATSGLLTQLRRSRCPCERQRRSFH